MLRPGITLSFASAWKIRGPPTNDARADGHKIMAGNNFKEEKVAHSKEGSDWQQNGYQQSYVSHQNIKDTPHPLS